MRFSTSLLLGGLAGAAVFMVMRRNGTMASVVNGLGEAVMRQAGQWKETAMEKGMNVKFGGGFLGNTSGANRISGSANSSGHKGGLDKVEHLASQDPKVKREVNEILQESGHHTI